MSTVLHYVHCNLLSKLLPSLQADLSGRDCTVDSLEQECQKLKIELESSKVNFERQVGGLREELQVMQEKKISFEVHMYMYVCFCCRELWAR